MAAIKFAADLDVNLNQLINALLEGVASDPGSPTEGQVWYNTTDDKFRYEDGAGTRTLLTDLDNLSDGFQFKGGIDASTNPDYPAADAGHTYKITVAGKIGGASGPAVEVGDTIYCTVDSTATGDHATVGANWVIVQANIDQATTTTVGFVELATTAEAEARTDTERAVVSSGLSNFSMAYSGVITASSGAIVTAGTHGLGASGTLVAQVFEGNDEVKASINVGATGDVTWATNQTITGRIIIQGK